MKDDAKFVQAYLSLTFIPANLPAEDVPSVVSEVSRIIGHMANAESKIIDAVPS